MLDYAKLFKRFSDIDSNYSVENTIKYLRKMAQIRGIDDTLVSTAINRAFLELAQGKEFSTEKCRCGCGLDKAGTDFIHYIRDLMYSLDKTIQTNTKDLLNNQVNSLILDHVSKENEKYLREQMGSIWERSPVLRWVKKWTGSQL